MHTDFLRQAIQLSCKNVAQGGGPFGAVIVRAGQVIAEGTNQVTTQIDPTAHAEIVAIRQACRALGTFSLGGCEIYTSCEPCPLCLSAIYWARLDRIFYAATCADAAAAGFDDAQFYAELAKSPAQRSIPSVGALREEAQTAFGAWAQQPNRVPY